MLFVYKICIIFKRTMYSLYTSKELVRTNDKGHVKSL